jgi:hypothetical protein
MAAPARAALRIVSRQTAVDRGTAAKAFGGEMGTSGSAARHGFWLHSLAGSAVAIALALAPQLASADEVGESFWTPGSFGSLAATASQPGFSLTSTYYHTSTSAGSEVARARLIRIGRVTGAVDENVSAISVQPEDLATITPSYTFATPVLGGQAAVAVSAGSAYEMGLAGPKAPETLIFVCL